MKFIIETVYENVNQEWMDWWLAQPKPKELKQSMEALSRNGNAFFISKDQTSEVKATTTWEVSNEKQ